MTTQNEMPIVFMGMVMFFATILIYVMNFVFNPIPKEREFIKKRIGSKFRFCINIRDENFPSPGMREHLVGYIQYLKLRTVSPYCIPSLKDEGILFIEGIASKGKDFFQLSMEVKNITGSINLPHSIVRSRSPRELPHLAMLHIAEQLEEMKQH